MLKQSFSSDCINKLLGKSPRKFDAIECGESQSSICTKPSRCLMHLHGNIKAKFFIGPGTNTYQFDNFYAKESGLNSKYIYDCSSLPDELVLKKLNDNLKKLFKIKVSDRYAIIKQTIALLKDTQPYTIIRLDIKDFYETIPRKDIISFIKNERLLSYENSVVLDSFDKKFRYGKAKASGLPRGVSISSTLSELYMRRFDRDVKQVKGIYFYARYVDDIIVLTTSSGSSTVDKIANILKEHCPKLNFNNSKQFIYDPRDQKGINKVGFNYLGYYLNISTEIDNDSSPRKVAVDISNIKVNKIKARVIKSFRYYERKGELHLLIARLRFLSGNQYVIGNVDRSRLKTGIYYNYPLITEKTKLLELDYFYKKLLKSKQPFIFLALKDCQKNGLLHKINNISFLFGFNNKVMNSVDFKLSRKIKGCW